jgi:Ca2+-binding RTX toxin-like protein
VGSRGEPEQAKLRAAATRSLRPWVATGAQLLVGWAAFGALLANVAGAGAFQETTCGGVAATTVGTEASELLIGTAGDDVIAGNGGDDRIIADGGNDRLCGGDGNDIIVAEDGNDFLEGGPGSDALAGGRGDDVMNGGGGVGPDAIDLAVFSEAAAAVSVDLRSGTASGEGNDTLNGLDSVIGSKYDDTLTGNAEINFLAPGGGNDVVDGAGGSDAVLFDVGVDADLRAGTASGEGSDRLDAVEGLIGASGDFADVFIGDGHGNYLSGGGGADVMVGGAGEDRVYGDAGNDRVLGGSGDDLMGGGAGNDAIEGGPGDLDAASYRSAAAAVQVRLGRGATGGAGDDRVRGVEGAAGSPFNDTLTGDSKANALVGGAGTDRIAGAGGSDFLSGGSRGDTLAGGQGSDYCLDGARKTACEAKGLPGKFPGFIGKPPATAAFRNASTSVQRAPAAAQLTLEDAPARVLADNVARIKQAVRALSACTRFSCTTPPAAPGSAGSQSIAFLPLPAIPPVLERSLAASRVPNYEYWGVPTCTSLRHPATTSIAPPGQVNPVGRDNKREDVLWQAALYRWDRTKHRWERVHQWPWQRAQIAGGPGVTGVPVWQNLNKSRFTTAIRRTVGAGRYGWGARLVWSRGVSQEGWVEPHVLRGGGKARYGRWCEFKD